MTWPGLDDAALEAAASRGLLRRAERDVAAGLATLRRHDAAQAEIEVEGAVVLLTPAGVKAARCTCPSREVCRHVLAAALLVRAAAPAGAATADPVAEIRAFGDADVLKAFGKPAVRDGAKLLAQAGPATIAVQGATCRIGITGQPEVAYSAGGGMAGMLSKAPASRTRALHAAAIQAVRGPALADPAPPAQEASDKPPDLQFLGPHFLGQVRAALLDAARSALRSAPRALEDRLLDLAISSRADAIPALSALLRRSALLVRARRDHDPGFDPADMLAVLARAFALVEALESPAGPLLRGTIRQPFEPVAGELDLVGCGVEVWHAASGARGVTAHLYAPGLGRWFSASIARAAGQDAAFSPTRAATRSAEAWGHRLAEIGTSRVRLTGAKASPSGRLSIGGDTRAALSPLATTGEAGAWQAAFDDWTRLEAHVAAAFSPSLQARAQGSVPVMLRPAAVGAARFDDAGQRLILPVQDSAGAWLALAADHDGGRPNREHWLEALAQARPACPAVIHATVAPIGGGYVLHSYGDTPADGSLPRSFDLVPVAKPVAGPVPPMTWPPQAGGSGQLLATMFDELLGFCELGGRMQDTGRTGRLAGLAERADSLGLQPASRVTARIAAADTPDGRVASILCAAHVIATLVALRRRLPWL